MGFSLTKAAYFHIWRKNLDPLLSKGLIPLLVIVQENKVKNAHCNGL